MNKMIEKQKIILASASARRRELMSLMGLEFTVIPSDADENIPEMHPSEYVTCLANRKAEFVARDHSDAIVIGADTIVVLDSAIIGKPRDEADAFRILRTLSGKTHTVYTGICVIANGHTLQDCDATDVTFCDLTDEDIRAYIATGDPMDKAGAYGVQGVFCINIEKICGSFFNVVGLPVHKLHRLLLQI